jgi:hypothetical protein
VPCGDRRQLPLGVTIAGPAPRTYLAAFLAAAAVTGCSGGSQANGTSDGRAGTSADHSVETREQGRCRVTLANHSIPPGEEHSPGARRAPYYGNGRLWTVLWPRGVVVARPRDVTPNGFISMKFPWWRGVRGDLKITGRRLDAYAPRLRAHIPSGYGAIGFQSTAIISPTKGCWQVTGHVGGVRLTFVTLVRVGRSPKRERESSGRPGASDYHD